MKTQDIEKFKRELHRLSFWGIIFGIVGAGVGGYFWPNPQNSLHMELGGGIGAVVGGTIALFIAVSKIKRR